MMIPQIHPTELKRMLDAGEPVYLVDVRNPDEYAYCRLPEGVLVPLPELPARVEEVQPPAGALVVVYCHHGVRSLRGAAVLRQAGHENVASLAGGIDAWSLTVDPAVPRY
jgi:rhodanese-related sulfurtransferase